MKKRKSVGKKHNNWYKKSLLRVVKNKNFLYFIIIGIILLFLVIDRLPQSRSSIIFPTPVPTIAYNTPTPVKDKIVSFATINGQIYMKYRGIVLSERAASQSNYDIDKISDPERYKWNYLMDAPPTDYGVDRFLDFKVFPNKQSFIFILRWFGAGKQDFKVFYYDANKTSNKITTILTTTDVSNKPDVNVPRIDQISPDEKYIAFNMYSCWNCDAGAPEKMLFDIHSGVAKRIGNVSYFKFKENGNYEYKEFKTYSCAIGYGWCAVDPKTLPLLTGSFN